MKKSIPAIIALIGGLLTIAFLGWAFSQHGTIGLYRVNGFFALIFNIFGALCLVLLAAAVFLQWRKARGKSGLRWLAVITVVLAVPAIVVPLAALALLNGALSGDIGDTPPRLLMTDTTGKYGVPDMAIVFTTASESAHIINWDGEAPVEPYGEPDLTKVHVFVLRDLKPDTTYAYQLDHDAPVSFTAPPVEGSLRFAVGSDAHYGAPKSDNDLTAAMLTRIADPANGYDAFFYLGDLVEYGFLNDQWRKAFISLDTVTGSIPSAFTAGNHDTLFSGTGNYLDYCVPEMVLTQSPSRLWYRVDIGKAHFLVLDVEWSAESVTNDQLQWLEGQLSSIPDDEWKIVMNHGFYYSSGVSAGGWDWFDNPETIEKLAPVFEEYSVDLVFSGHNHRLELLEESGVTYVVCGSFGGHPDPEPTYVSPASIWGASGATAFVDVTLNGGECELVFRDAGDEVLHETSLTRN